MSVEQLVQEVAGLTSANQDLVVAVMDVKSAASAHRDEALDYKDAAQAAKTSAENAMSAAQTARTETAADRVQTGLDRIAAAGSAQAAQVSATQAHTIITGGVEYKGTWDASSGALPEDPVSRDFWKISGAGTIEGVVYEINNDLIYNGTAWEQVPVGGVVGDLITILDSINGEAV